MSELWYEASADQEAIAREGALAQAEAHLAPVWPFLFEARSDSEFEHRLAFAGHRLSYVAAHSGLSEAEVADIAWRRFALVQEARLERQALPEGQDPLAWVPDGGGSGSGPEKLDEHEEVVSYAGGYSEVPQGAPGGPSPQVTAPRAEPPAPVSEATAARLPKGQCKCGCKLSRKGKCHGCKDAPGSCSCGPDAACGGMEGAGKTAARRLALAPSSPPSSQAMLPAGTGTGSVSPDGVPAGGSLLTSTSRAPVAAPAVGTQQSSSTAGYDLTPSQDVTASRRVARLDPVHAQVKAVAASVAAANPHLPPSECRRIARQVVGGYLLRSADLTNSVVHDAPLNDPSSSGGSGGSGGGGGFGEYMLGRQLLNKLPGLGGGGGEAGGEAAGGAAEVAELAPLAAL